MVKNTSTNKQLKTNSEFTQTNQATGCIISSAHNCVKQSHATSTTHTSNKLLSNKTTNIGVSTLTASDYTTSND